MAASVAAFPAVNTQWMTSAASQLQNVADNMLDIGVNVGTLQTEVTGNEAWKGKGATAWGTVMTSRVADANLSNEVLGKASSLLSQLASDLDAQQKTYNSVKGQMDDVAAAANAQEPPVILAQGWDAQYVSDMNAAVNRANTLLDNFGTDFTALAALSAGITATTAANRTPGEPGGPGSGSNKGITVLATLADTVGGDSSPTATSPTGISDDAFEAQVLGELGLPSNSKIVMQGFEGRTTPGGAPKGVKPDSMDDTPGNGYVLEIKNVTNAKGVSANFQIRAEAAYARLTSNPYWVIVPKGAKVSANVVKLAEKTGGGVVYRSVDSQGNVTYEDGQGNPVTIGPKMQVSGYQPTTTGAAGGGGAAGTGTTDPQAPSGPVSPGTVSGQPDAGTGDGGDGGGDDDPGVGGGDDDPFIDPLP